MRYSDTLAAILKNPLDAHLELLGDRLSPETQALAHELKAIERERKELGGAADQLESYSKVLTERLGEIQDPLQEPAWMRQEIGSLSQQAIKLRNEADNLKARCDGLKGSLRMAIEAAWTGKLLKDISIYIPKQLGQLCVSSGEGAALHFGLGLRRREEGARWAPSGSEWNVIVTALACWSASEHDCVIPADRAIDAGLLVEWLKVLSKAPCQVLMTTVYPLKALPTGWKALKVGR